jgi:transposase
MAKQEPPARRYPRELRERAVRMVLDTIEETGKETGVITRIARQLGLQAESLRTWVRAAQVEMGTRPGRSPKDISRIGELEKKVKELERSNEILKTAAVFFARELDPPHQSS